MLDTRSIKIGINTAVFLLLLLPPAAAVLSPRFPDFVEAVVKDHNSAGVALEALRRDTPLWSDGIGLYNTALYEIGVSPNPNQLVMGKDGYMFLGNDHSHAYDQVIHRYDPPQQEIEDWVQVLQYERDHLARQGIPMVFVVAPSPGTIYPDKLANVPPGFARQPSVFDRVLTLARERGLPLMDVRNALSEGRKVHDTYAKMNSHWNDYGAWVAWKEVAAEIERIMPGAKMAALQETTPVETIDGFNEGFELLNIRAPHDWVRPVREVNFPDYYIVSPDGTRTLTPGETGTLFRELPRTTHSPNSTSDLRVLLLTDSMGTSMSPYWTASFRDLFQINHHVRADPSTFNFEKIVSDVKPQLVVYLMTERYFAHPLGDAAALSIKQSFDAPDLPSDQVWPPQPGRLAPEIKADATLSELSTVVLAQSPGRKLVRLGLTADGPGLLYVGYMSDGVLTEGWHAFAKGDSDVYVAVPENLDWQSLSILRDLERGNATLRSVRVRTVE